MYPQLTFQLEISTQLDIPHETKPIYRRSMRVQWSRAESFSRSLQLATQGTEGEKGKGVGRSQGRTHRATKQIQLEGLLKPTIFRLLPAHVVRGKYSRGDRRQPLKTQVDDRRMKINCKETRRSPC